MQRTGDSEDVSEIQFVGENRKAAMRSLVLGFMWVLTISLSLPTAETTHHSGEDRAKPVLWILPHTHW